MPSAPDCQTIKNWPWPKIRIGIIVSILLIIVLICVALELSKNKRDADLEIEKENYHNELVEKVNKGQKDWKAEYNKYAVRTMDQIGWQNEALPPEWGKLNNESVHANLPISRAHWAKLKATKIDLPENFDSRKRWPNCWTLHTVGNQGGCGSCWAVAATSVISDRICVGTNGTQQPQMSAQDLLGCCPHCGTCQGSSGSLLSYEQWMNTGLVTGGGFGSEHGCKPYEYSPECGSPCSPQVYNSKRAPKCKKECNELYSKSYEEDKYFGRETYILNIDWETYNLAYPTGIDVNELVKKDLYLYGPLLSCFFVYEDFQHYRSGIYKHYSGEALYGHCTKLLGWGKENGNEYWIMANSWGRNWGENGFFRRMFTSEPLPEVVGGLP